MVTAPAPPDLHPTSHQPPGRFQPLNPGELCSCPLCTLPPAKGTLGLCFLWFYCGDKQVHFHGAPALPCPQHHPSVLKLHCYEEQNTPRSPTRTVQGVRECSGHVATPMSAAIWVSPLCRENQTNPEKPPHECPASTNWPLSPLSPILDPSRQRAQGTCDVQSAHELSSARPVPASHTALGRVPALPSASARSVFP